MKQIALAWKEFFRQFAPYVFAENEIIADEFGQQINDPNNVLYPRITYSYAVGDIFTNNLITFQVWDYAHSNDTLLTICERIAAAVPVEAGTAILIPGEVYHEYRNPITGIWHKFDVGDFQSIADEFAPTPIEWRRVEKESAGELTIWRGSPFLTPRSSDERLSRIMYGTLACRYRTIV